MPEFIRLGKSEYNADYLKSVTEKEAIEHFVNRRPDQVRNAWKQVNGKSVRTKKKVQEKPEETEN